MLMIYLCLSLTAHIQLLQPECEMASYTFPNHPRQAVASWLKHTVKLPKLLSDGHGRLINLNTAQQIAHDCGLKIASGST
jgi:hypothetical protein